MVDDLAGCIGDALLKRPGCAGPLGNRCPQARWRRSGHHRPGGSSQDGRPAISSQSKHQRGSSQSMAPRRRSRWAPARGAEHPAALGPEHVVELRVNSASRSRVGSTPLVLVIQHEHEAAGWLGDPAALRVGGHRRDHSLGRQVSRTALILG
jgi:hypothetical protein